MDEEPHQPADHDRGAHIDWTRIVDYAAKHRLYDIIKVCEGEMSQAISEPTVRLRLSIAMFQQVLQDREYVQNYIFTTVLEMFEKAIPPRVSRAYNSQYFSHLIEMKIQALMSSKDNMRLFKRKAQKLFKYTSEKKKSHKYHILKDAHDDLLEYHGLKLAQKFSSPKFRAYQQDHLWDDFVEDTTDFLSHQSKNLGEPALDQIENEEAFETKRAVQVLGKDAPIIKTRGSRDKKAGNKPNPNRSARMRQSARVKSGFYDEDSPEDNNKASSYEDEDDEGDESEYDDDKEYEDDDDEDADNDDEGNEDLSEEEKPVLIRKGLKTRKSPRKRFMKVKKHRESDRKIEILDSPKRTLRPRRRRRLHTVEEGEASTRRSVGKLTKNLRSARKARRGKRRTPSGETSPEEAEIETADESDEEKEEAAWDEEPEGVDGENQEDTDSGHDEGATEEEETPEDDSSAESKGNVSPEKSKQSTNAALELEETRKRLRSKIKDPLKDVMRKAKKAKKSETASKYDFAHPDAKEVSWEEEEEEVLLESPKRKKFASLKSKAERVLSPNGFRKRKRWTADEIEKLRKGVAEFGNKWVKIKSKYDLPGRTAPDLKDKWRNLMMK